MHTVKSGHHVKIMCFRTIQFYRFLAMYTKDLLTVNSYDPAFTEAPLLFDILLQKALHVGHSSVITIKRSGKEVYLLGYRNTNCFSTL
jgi:hypothetical protein